MVGQLMRGRRLALGLSQTELARRAGSSQRQVSRLENDEDALPRRDTLERFGAVLGVTIGEWYRAAGIVEDRGEATPAADNPEDRIWRAIWNNRPLSAQLRRAMRHESEEEYQHLLDRSFELTAKSLEIDLDELERRRGDAAPVPVGPN